MIAQLPPDLAEFVASELAVGRYETEAQLVCDAVRTLRDKLQRIRDAVQEGLANPEDDIELANEAELSAFLNQVFADAVAATKA
jgi:Arc/MetJ-type ribon-helix-helix transcriptional regulator